MLFVYNPSYTAGARLGTFELHSSSPLALLVVVPDEGVEVDVEVLTGGRSRVL